MTVEPMFIFCLCAPCVCNALRPEGINKSPGPRVTDCYEPPCELNPCPLEAQPCLQFLFLLFVIMCMEGKESTHILCIQ